LIDWSDNVKAAFAVRILGQTLTQAPPEGIEIPTGQKRSLADFSRLRMCFYGLQMPSPLSRRKSTPVFTDLTINCAKPIPRRLETIERALVFAAAVVLSSSPSCRPLHHLW
jgi:hypothetical protein